MPDEPSLVRRALHREVAILGVLKPSLVRRALHRDVAILAVSKPRRRLFKLPRPLGRGT